MGRWTSAASALATAVPPRWDGTAGSPVILHLQPGIGEGRAELARCHQRGLIDHPDLPEARALEVMTVQVQVP